MSNQEIVQLPRKCGEWDRLIALGIKKLDDVDKGGYLNRYGKYECYWLGREPHCLVNVQLPPGWTVLVGHEYTELLDANRRIRVTIHHGDWRRFSISYGHAELHCRFKFTEDPDTDCVRVIDTSARTELYRSMFEGGPYHRYAAIEVQGRAQEQYKQYELAAAQAKAWLDRTYPDWQNPGAYWEMQSVNGSG